MNFHIYCIPGLGLNEKIFSNLHLNPYKVSMLNWIEPTKNESLNSYVQRISENIILHDDEELILIGHSFGGVLAQEIAQIKKVKLIFLISSIKMRKELSNTLFFAHLLKLYHLVSKKLIVNAFPLYGSRHGFNTVEKRALFEDMIQSHSNHYLQWAIKTIGAWKGVPDGLPIFQIHGSSDIVFRCAKIQEPYFKVNGGNHIMVYDMADQINSIIMEQLHKLSESKL